MSKGNLFLGLATGKIGSVVLYRAFGEERARSWVARKANPRTWRQAVTRCIAKTVHVSYSSLITLCRESFQGLQPGTPCQSAFLSRNSRILRARIAGDIEAGREAVLESAVGNYLPMGGQVMPYNALMVSDGGLSPIGATMVSGVVVLPSMAGVTWSDASTYADFCRVNGFDEGDRLDIILARFDAASGVLRWLRHCRVVLRPSSGDMSAAFAAGGVINLPDAGNFGDVRFAFSAGELSIVNAGFTVAVGSELPNAGCIVRSRQFGDMRQYSPEYLAAEVAEGSSIADAAPLGTAVASYMGGVVYLDGA